jgi:simple sugar transport system substrate-binding protein
VKVDYLEISAEVNSDSSLAVPVLTAYIAKNPNVKGIGTQHGVTSVIPKALQAAGKKPGESSSAGSTCHPRRSMDSRRVGLRSRWTSSSICRASCP